MTKIKLISIHRFCAEYSIGKTTAYDLLRRKELLGYKVGGRTLICLESIERWAATLPRFQSQAPS